MKYMLLLFTLFFLFTGCATREYYNIEKHNRNLETDKARCTYLAESKVPLYRPTLIVNINKGMSEKERRELKSRQWQEKQQNEFRRDRQVNRLKDACLRAMGWRWKMVE